MIEKIITSLETIPLLGRLFTFLYGLGFVCKKDFRLIQNLGRPIMIINSSGKDMDLIAAHIRDAGFFRLESPSKTDQNLDRLTKHSIVVVGYTEGESDVNKIISAVKAKSLPVIFFAEQGEISEEDKKAVYGYSYAEIANSPFRLMNLIFSILSTYKFNQ